MQADADGQLTEYAVLQAGDLGIGIFIRVHAVPFQLSPNRYSEVGPYTPPAATQNVAEAHDTE
jgi:hypothetical protein